MATKKKMLQAAAGQAGGAALDITDVFSTYLYEGNGATQTITNGIDLDGEGGLVWVKSRGSTANHVLVDTERGVRRNLSSNTTDAEGSVSGDNVNAFYSNGFLAGPDGKVNAPSGDYASWTFRKAPKFFDVVTYTGDGTGTRQLSHNLGTTVGSVFVKTTSVSDPWIVWHRGMSSESTLKDYYLQLNTTDSIANTFGNIWGSTNNVTDSTFQLGTNINQSGVSYVAYVFAHNDGDGGFGPDGDQDIIKCGSYSQSSASDVDVDLGFEPQFVIVKRSDDTSQWYILDEMRGFLAGSNSTSSRTLYASLANAEADFTIQKTATGFTWPSGQYGSGTQEYIYMAIRRGPLAQPESATEVFAMDTLGSTTPNPPSYNAGFPVDLGIMKSKTSGTDPWRVGARLTGEKQLRTNATDAEITDTQHKFDYQDGWYDAGSYVDSQYQSWMWKRAPGFFDVVAYSGSTSTQNISHNLGVQPEMIWIKNRSFSGTSWPVLFTSLGARKYLNLNTTDAAITLPLFNGTDFFANTLPTSSVFTVGGGTAGGGYDDVGSSGSNYIAYLFATLPGVSKVGSYTGNSTGNASGITQTIDCGFTSGARFVLIKKTNGTGSWCVFDTARGIVAGNDPYLALNETAAESTVTDAIDPHSSGFTLTSSTLFNSNGDTYIFYAIA